MTSPVGDGRESDRRHWPRLLILACLAYLPILLAHPGKVAADTKAYLYLDPARLLSRAWSLWDPNVALGTVTHQNIIYLWPMGPYYWLMERAGVPDWVAQRVWLASIVFLAGAGVVFLLRTLGSDRDPPDARSEGRRLRLGTTGMLAAACLYMLSPYLLDYSARISVLLTPWAALPWLIALAHRALHRGGWRDPAIFALVVLSANGSNATALLLAGVGPVLWLILEVVAHRKASWTQLWAAAWRIGVLSIGVSLWWLVALVIQGRYGIDILRFTETIDAVAATSQASEVLRGLGYWLFYGGDDKGQWIAPGRDYTELVWLIGIGFAVPLVAMVAGVTIRWRYRIGFTVLLLVGLTIAVGTYPFDSPSPFGALLKWFTFSSTAGLALRSTARAVPLVVLSLAVFTGAGLSGMARRWPRASFGASGFVILLAIANLPVIFTGDYVDANLERDEDIPTYWVDATSHLDASGSNTRVLELPGIDFASYRWGDTVDPITPGLMDRPTTYRELIPFGGTAGASTVLALDRRLQEGVLDPDAIAPVARLLGVGDIVIRNDLAYERYQTARPRTVSTLLTPTPEGLDDPVGFGSTEPNRADADLPLLDEQELSTPNGTPWPRQVEIYTVQDAQGIVRAHANQRSVVLAGDGEGVVTAASAGLIDGTEPLFYAASLDADATLADQAIDPDATLVITDSNRRRAMRWRTNRGTSGYTERAGESPLVRDTADTRLDPFPDAADDERTVTVQRGGATAAASNYGNPVTYTPENRAVNAVDGNLDTAWTVGAFSDVAGEYLRITFDEPVTPSTVRLVQSLSFLQNRSITRVGIWLDGTHVASVELTDASLTPEGQTVDVGDITFSQLDLVIEADSEGLQASYDGLSGVGFAEVDVADVTVREVVRVPTGLLDRMGTASLDHDLAFAFERLRTDPHNVVRSDEERTIDRLFSIPTERSFSLTGQARISADVSDPRIDELLGTTGPRTNSSGRLPGNVAARASSAFDGDRSTSWSNHFGEQRGAWIEVSSVTPVTTDHLMLEVVADGRHSVPSRVTLVVDGTETASLDVDALTASNTEGATVSVRLDLGRSVTGTTFRLVVTDVVATTTIDYYSRQPIDMPVAIAELSIGDLRTTTPAQFPSICRGDLVTVDADPVEVRLVGTTAAANAGEALALEACGPALTLATGSHELSSAPGDVIGIDLDTVQLRSRPGGGAGAGPTRDGAADPVVTVTGDGRNHTEVTVTNVDGPFWLVSGQTQNAGWSATAAGIGDLGPSSLTDGFASGWYIDPGDATTLTVSMHWQPQRWVNVGLFGSAMATIACLALLVATRRRQRWGAELAKWPRSPWLVGSMVDGRPRPDTKTVVIVSLGIGVVAGMLSHPAIGALVAALTAGALVVPFGPSLLGAAAVLAMALTGAYVAVKQQRNGYPAQAAWPAFFEAAHYLAWLAVLLFVAHVVVSLVRSDDVAPIPPPTDDAAPDPDRTQQEVP